MQIYIGLESALKNEACVDELKKQGHGVSRGGALGPFESVIETIKMSDMLLVILDETTGCSTTWAEIGVALALNKHVWIHRSQSVHEEIKKSRVYKVYSHSNVRYFYHWTMVARAAQEFDPVIDRYFIHHDTSLFTPEAQTKAIEAFAQKNDFVAFCGLKFAGKDTSAEILASSMANKKTKFTALAGALKSMCRDVFDLTIEQLHVPRHKERLFSDDGCGPIVFDADVLAHLVRALFDYVPLERFPYPPWKEVRDKIEAIEVPYEANSARDILMYVGTEIIRDIIGDSWHVAGLFNDDCLERTDTTFFITDVRFSNEFLFLDAFKPSWYYIERPVPKNLDEPEVKKHRTESEGDTLKAMILENGGRVVVNDGTLDDLKHKLLG